MRYAVAAIPAGRGSRRRARLLHHVAEVVAVHVRRRHLQVFHHLLGIGLSGAIIMALRRCRREISICGLDPDRALNLAA
jgi:hypothetical protein